MMTTENNGQITVWDYPKKQVEEHLKECPECHTIDNIEHFEGCSKPKMISKHVTTTQFGPCAYDSWCEQMRDKLNSAGRKTIIRTNTDGMIALFDLQVASHGAVI